MPTKGSTTYDSHSIGGAGRVGAPHSLSVQSKSVAYSEGSSFYRTRNVAKQQADTHTIDPTYSVCVQPLTFSLSKFLPLPVYHVRRHVRLEHRQGFPGLIPAARSDASIDEFFPRAVQKRLRRYLITNPPYFIKILGLPPLG